MKTGTKIRMALIGSAVALSAVFGLLLATAAPVFAASEEGYPHRAKFPNVKYITTEALNKSFGKVLIVDVRSELEFNVIHINGARHIPVATMKFGDDVKAVRAADPSAAIVFYCNGHDCAKSYEACEQAATLGIADVIAYDSGIHDWVHVYPEKTTLMGETPASVKKLISKEDFLKHKIGFGEFRKKAGAPNAVVIDAREPFQRKELPDLPNLRNIPTDRLVKLLEDKSVFKGQTLLITDAVGKQVEWIQYYLERYGYSSYYFLDKGVLSAKEAGAIKAP